MKSKTSNKYLDPTKPVAIWKSRDLLDGEATATLTAILRTRGCRWNRCLMCGYASEGAPATAQDLLIQLEQVLRSLSSEQQMVKIYTSGSFLDPYEVPIDVREKVLSALQERGIKRLVIESRPEYINSKAVEDCLSKVDTEFAMGLESSNDLIREKLIQKGFSFKDFTEASELIHELGGRVKAYILLKPPHLSEREAIRDAIASAGAARRFSDVLSLNLCNIQRGTYVERLWERGEYRPPWLWSALEVLKASPKPIICDPVGAGSRRGPHNCGQCDALFADAIRKHALSQDLEVFEGLDCSCKLAWQKVLDLEERAFGAQIA